MLHATSRIARPVHVACVVRVAFCVTRVAVGSVVHYERVNSRYVSPERSRQIQGDQISL